MLQKEIEFIEKNLTIFCCPKCAGDVSFAGGRFDCLKCRQSYPVSDDIPQLFWSNEWDSLKEDVTEKVKAFYEENPFPNYNDFDNVGTLISRARKNLLASLIR